MVSVCLPSDALLQHLPSYLGFSYLGRRVSLHGCFSKVQPLLLSPGSWCTQGSVCALWESDHNHRKLTKLITWTTALFNSVKLWATSCRAAQDGRVIVKRSDKMWSTGEGNGNHFSILALRTPWTVWKGKKWDTERWTPQDGRCPICYWRSLEK